VQAAAAPVAKKANLMDMLNATPTVNTTANTGFYQPQQQGTGYGMGIGMGHRQTNSLSTQPTQFSSPMTPQRTQQPQQNLFGGVAPMQPTSSLSHQPATSAKPTAAPAKSGNFDDLWSLSLGGPTAAKPGSAGAGKSIKDLEKEKAMAGLWGGQQRPTGGIPPQAAAFGTFGNGAPASSSAGGADDLLL